jgi:hypothetical protein
LAGFLVFAGYPVFYVGRAAWLKEFFAGLYSRAVGVINSFCGLSTVFRVFAGPARGAGREKAPFY